MINKIADFLRALHVMLGITTPAAAENQLPFVLMWLGIVVFLMAFCVALVYALVSFF